MPQFLLHCNSRATSSVLKDVSLPERADGAAHSPPLPPSVFP